MFEKFAFTIYYNVNGSGRVAQNENEDFSIEKFFSDNRLVINLLPKVKMELVHVDISSEYLFEENTSVLANGYQSWTLTKEWKNNEVMKGIRFPVRNIKFGRELAAVFGDYNWYDYKNEAGKFHGYTFGYIRDGERYRFIGSLNERTGYTIINFDMIGGKITVEKEVEGKTVENKYNLFDILFIESNLYDKIFDDYFTALNVKPCRVSHTCGYTSWYNYFTNINEEIILRDLQGLSRTEEKISIFQIDDGHQTKIGDWAETDKVKFPHGMKYIVDKIHEKDVQAGLWLAPFYVQKDSKIAAAHPEWIVKGKDGRPTKGFVGNRQCYTLNFYVKECADYIRGFFNTILNDWGFDMVKLDFLCTACLVPYGNRTRGEIMCDAMDFLRDCVGEKIILGCGVPLAPAFGKVDFCRIGSDVDIQFKPRFIFSLTNNEVVSTQTSIQNAIFRRGLDGRAFGNDPDVFFMREINLKYTETEKRLVAEINKTFGRLLFISDNVSEFSEKQLDFLNEIYKPSMAKIEFVDYIGDNTASIVYTEDGQKYMWKLNWLTGENSREKI